MRPHRGGMLPPLSRASTKCGQKQLQTRHEEKFLPPCRLQELCWLSCCGHAAVGSWTAAGTPALSNPWNASSSHFGRDFLSFTALWRFPAGEPSLPLLVSWKTSEVKDRANKQSKIPPLFSSDHRRSSGGWGISAIRFCCYQNEN